MAKDKIPTSRIARTAKVSSLAAGQAARHLGTRATNVARSEQGKSAALERRHLEAAEQIVSALGTMKGAAMKLGQVMSFLDVGLVPEEHREEFQRNLQAVLCDTGAVARIEAMIDELTTTAVAAIEAAPIPQPAVAALVDLAAYVARRGA